MSDCQHTNVHDNADHTAEHPMGCLMEQSHWHACCMECGSVSQAIEGETPGYPLPRELRSPDGQRYAGCPKESPSGYFRECSPMRGDPDDTADPEYPHQHLKYYAARRCCPVCGNGSISKTCVATCPPDGNRATCMNRSNFPEAFSLRANGTSSNFTEGCGWRGTVHELVARPGLVRNRPMSDWSQT